MNNKKKLDVWSTIGKVITMIILVLTCVLFIAFVIEGGLVDIIFFAAFFVFLYFLSKYLKSKGKI